MTNKSKTWPLLFALFFSGKAFGQNPEWKHLATDLGDLAMPWKNLEQTAALVADIDKDGVNDFVLGASQQGPALVWYQRKGNGWVRYVVEDQALPLESGGLAYDIDGDGDLDLVFGGNGQSSSLWWWENPFPQMDYHWKRHVIKSEGAPQHQDQIIGKFRQDNRTELVFWNQGNKTLYMASLPANPKTDNWEYHTIYQASGKDAQGLACADVDGDGYEDIITGSSWLKYDAATDKFRAIRFATTPGKVAAGKFKPGKTLQLVIAPQDGSGPVSWYECTGNPENPKDWIGHDLAGRELQHAHSLQVADLNGDGNLDVWVAEMAKWTQGAGAPDNLNAEALIFWGNGRGSFSKTVFQKGMDFHEARLADLDGDGDLDILDKPYIFRAPRIDIWLQHGTGKPLEPLRKIIPESIGLEVYTLRREFKEDFEGTLQKISDLGFSELEVGGFNGLTCLQYKEALKKHHLRPTSILFSYEMLRDSLDRILEYAKTLGVGLVGCAWIPHAQAFSLADAQKAVELFNLAGQKLQEKGMHFIYHAHGYEFEPRSDGSTLFDFLANGMKSGVADFEMDVFWAYHGGMDPALLLRKYPGRFLALHLKQMKPGQPTGIYSGNAPDESSVSLGAGVLDFKQILQTAMQTGVLRYYIEDEAPNAAQQLKESQVYLQSLIKK